MGTIVVFENVSLDGVMQDPTGEEGFSRADWRDVLTPADRDAWNKLILDDALGADALLLGRRSYEFFAGRYPSRTGALADRMNGLPKYVVSTTLTNPAWNSTVITVDEVSQLKETVDGEIRIYASSGLVHTLMGQHLVDEVRLAVHPILMGAGDRVFDPAGGQQRLRLIDTRLVGDSVGYLAYGCVPEGSR